MNRPLLEADEGVEEEDLPVDCDDSVEANAMVLDMSHIISHHRLSLVIFELRSKRLSDDCRSYAIELFALDSAVLARRRVLLI